MLRQKIQKQICSNYKEICRYLPTCKQSDKNVHMTVGLTVVTLRDGRHADADGRLLGDRMDGVGAVDVGEGETEVLLHSAQAKVFGVQVNQGAQQSSGTLLTELPAAPQALLLHSTPQRAWRGAATLFTTQNADEEEGIVMCLGCLSSDFEDVYLFKI